MRVCDMAILFRFDAELFIDDFIGEEYLFGERLCF